MGKPMISWSIEAALDSGLFDSVLVSTDCQDIADIALKYGADVPFFEK
jgi:N-acylneuraminate cytidylyltransferase